MNLNKLAKDVTQMEGLKKSISIAQVKEVLGITFRTLSQFPDEEVLKVIKRYRR